eukprot:5080061-Pleurochrysis_carterae.AAC.1
MHACGTLDAFHRPRLAFRTYVRNHCGRRRTRLRRRLRLETRLNLRLALHVSICASLRALVLLLLPARR